MFYFAVSNIELHVQNKDKTYMFMRFSTKHIATTRTTNQSNNHSPVGYNRYQYCEHAVTLIPIVALVNLNFRLI